MGNKRVIERGKLNMESQRNRIEVSLEVYKVATMAAMVMMTMTVMMVKMAMIVRNVSTLPCYGGQCAARRQW